MMSGRIAIVAALLAATGCYQASVDACRLRCNNLQCPDGLTCNMQGFCAESETATCGGDGTDAAIDADTCGWQPVSNVSPCTLGADQATTPLVIPVGATVRIRTTDPASALPAGVLPASAFQLAQLANLDRVIVLSVGALDVAGQLIVEGPLPLIILVNGNVMISGSLSAEPFGDDLQCIGRGMNGADHTRDGGAGGGGGGSFGTLANSQTVSGAAGGGGGDDSNASNGGAGGEPGPIAPLMNLRPLRKGCKGGTGGEVPNIAKGGTGGNGGGAIQLSARGSLRIEGVNPTNLASIAANGAGGLDEPGLSGGGGAGGSGGGILLEGPTVLLQNAILCANGGGGASWAAPGLAGQCSVTPAAGGLGAPNDLDAGRGGDGAAGGRNATPGLTGAMYAPSNNPPNGTGGGGGGGGFGVIRINGILMNTGGVMSTPAWSN